MYINYLAREIKPDIINWIIPVILLLFLNAIWFLMYFSIIIEYKRQGLHQIVILCLYILFSKTCKRMAFLYKNVESLSNFINISPSFNNHYSTIFIRSHIFYKAWIYIYIYWWSTDVYKFSKAKYRPDLWDLIAYDVPSNVMPIP